MWGAALVPQELSESKCMWGTKLVPQELLESKCMWGTELVPQELFEPKCVRGATLVPRTFRTEIKSSEMFRVRMILAWQFENEQNNNAQCWQGTKLDNSDCSESPALAMLISTMLLPPLFAFSFLLFFTLLSPPSECSNPTLLWNSKTNCTSLLSITLGFTLWLDELLHSIHTPHAALRNSKTNCTCLLSTTLGLTLLLDEVLHCVHTPLMCRFWM